MYQSTVAPMERSVLTMIVQAHTVYIVVAHNQDALSVSYRMTDSCDCTAMSCMSAGSLRLERSAWRNASADSTREQLRVVRIRATSGWMSRCFGQLLGGVEVGVWPIHFLLSLMVVTDMAHILPSIAICICRVMRSAFSVRTPLLYQAALSFLLVG